MAFPARMTATSLRMLIRPPAQFVRSYASHQKKGRAKASALRPRTAPPSERVAPTAPARKAAAPSLHKAATPPPPPPPPPSPLPPALKRAAENLAFDIRLGKEKGPTLLYSKFSGKYLVASYGLALVCFIYVADTIQTRIIDPMFELQGWLKSTYWVSITIMSGLTVFFLWRPTRLIQKIYAHPVAAVGNKAPSVNIILHRRPIFPLLPEKKIVVSSPQNIELDSPVQPLIEVKPAEATEEVGFFKRVTRAITGTPFRIFSSARSYISSEDFVTLRVDDGGTYFLHKDGFVWQRRGLDRLFRAKVETKY